MGSPPGRSSTEEATALVAEPASVSGSHTAGRDTEMAAARPEIGSTLGRYVLLDRVGEGGMGVVYRAYDPKLSREVAIKMVTIEADDRGRGRLLREAQALAQLTHPNVVPVYDVGEAEGLVFIVMEYVAGDTLRDWMRRGPHPWPQVVERMLQAGEGLAAAHAAGLVHRDFKPANVLLGDGRARVVDFGLARALEGADVVRSSASLSDVSASGDDLPSVSMLGQDMTQAGVVVGTPSYMSPRAAPRAGGGCGERPVRVLRRAVRGAVRAAPVPGGEADRPRPCQGAAADRGDPNRHAGRPALAARGGHAWHLGQPVRTLAGHGDPDRLAPAPRGAPPLAGLGRRGRGRGRRPRGSRPPPRRGGRAVPRRVHRRGLGRGRPHRHR